MEDLKDGGGGVRNVLLVNVIKGGPGGDRDVGEGGGGNGGGLGGNAIDVAKIIYNIIARLITENGLKLSYLLQQHYCKIVLLN